VPTGEPVTPAPSTEPTSEPTDEVPAGQVTDAGEALAEGGTAAASPGEEPERSGSLTAPLLVVPLGLGVLLVLAAAGVGLVSGERDRSLARGGAALPWHRHRTSGHEPERAPAERR